MASITDIVGGRSGAYENALQRTREAACARWNRRPRKPRQRIIGVDIDYESRQGWQHADGERQRHRRVIE